MNKILIVEDNRDTGLVVKEYLEINDVMCDIAFDGAEALKKFSASRHVVLLTDVRLPDMDGVSLARQCAGQRPDLHVVFMTAHELRKKDLRNFKSSLILNKPCHPSRILETINRLLETK